MGKDEELSVISTRIYIVPDAGVLSVRQAHVIALLAFLASYTPPGAIRLRLWLEPGDQKDQQKERSKEYCRSTIHLGPPGWDGTTLFSSHPAERMPGS